jgi:hypothetical protein
MEMVKNPITLKHLREIAEVQFGDIVKAVVDVSKAVMVIGGELHADEEALLLDLGCKQNDIWGINLYPDDYGNDDWIEFDSMINVRPGQSNRSRFIENPELRRQIREIVNKLVIANG